MIASLFSASQIDAIEHAAAGGPILVAFSGGGDSTALLLALCDALGPTRLHAIIVDHALRDGSATDARRAAEAASAFGVESRIHRIAWPNGPKRAQAAARVMRHQALCDAARACGAALIALGHTLDDQAETMLLRADAGSGLRGLAAMRAFSPAPLWPEGRDLWIARPLLSHRRADLRSWLRAREARWIEDPANANVAFARVRARERLAGMESEGFDVARLFLVGEALGVRNARRDQKTRRLVDEAVDFLEPDLFVRRDAWSASDVAIRRRALAVLVVTVAGAAYEPAPEAIARLDRAILEPEFHGATLGGAVIVPRQDGLIFRRDRGGLVGRADGAAALPSVPLRPGETIVWDRRLEATASESGWVLTPGPGPAPVVECRDEALCLAEAEKRNIVRTNWLLKRRIAHLLPALSPAFIRS